MPAPLPPSRPWTWRGATVKSTPSRATTGPKVLRMPDIRRRGAAAGAAAVVSLIAAGQPILEVSSATVTSPELTLATVSSTAVLTSAGTESDMRIFTPVSKPSG